MSRNPLLVSDALEAGADVHYNRMDLEETGTPARSSATSRDSREDFVHLTMEEKDDFMSRSSLPSFTYSWSVAGLLSGSPRSHSTKASGEPMDQLLPMNRSFVLQVTSDMFAVLLS